MALHPRAFREADDAMLAQRSSTSGCPTTPSSQQSVHPLLERKKLMSCIRLLDTKRFASLPCPLPRSQDLPEEYFGTPSSVVDPVVSVSHAWRNQVHPDPTGHKSRVLTQLLEKVHALGAAAAEDGGDDERRSVLLFLDFLSIPQRPFTSSQSPRTEEEVVRFRNALEYMHEMYLYADFIIHLPWDDAEEAEEGAEWTVSSTELKDVDFVQTGGSCVQISERCRLSPRKSVKSLLAGLASHSKPKSFAQVVAVDDEPVSSVEQLESLLTAGAGSVKLRSYPYGLSNTIPSEERGWIFLERFISMVKCAMMDEETAKRIVITPSDAIFRQIMEGADKLRRASMRDLNSKHAGELERVLEEFKLELQSKQFSPASIDKREMSSMGSMQADRELVCTIMQKFVSHLAVHWDAEAAKQRSSNIAKRLRKAVAATEDFLLEWDCFSEAYTAKLALAMKKVSLWPLLLLTLQPLVACTGVLLFPYAHPGEGWKSQVAFWAWGCPLVLFLCQPCVPAFLAVTSGVRCSRSVVLRLIMWGLASSAVSVAIFLALAYSLDVFPVPMTHLMGIPIACSLMPLLWWCIPKDQRDDVQFRWRLLYSAVGIGGMLTLLGNVFPLLNAAVAVVSEGWQALLVFGYLAGKLSFEVLGLRLSPRLGADVMPYFLFWATMAYQVNCCVIFSKVSSWLVVMEQISFDVLENVYHLWSLWRCRGSGRQEQYIVASLVLREFAELLAPAQFLSIYSMMRGFRPEYSDLLCAKGVDGTRQTQLFLLGDLAINLIVSCLTYLILVRRGHAPLLLLQGLISTRLVLLLAIANVALVYYMSLQHSHFGMDLSFRWLWIFEEDSDWKCGLSWTLEG